MEALQLVHDSGYTYNDLKLDNIMINQKKDGTKDDFEVVLIDYGFAKKYCDKNGDHLQQKEMETF